MGWGNLLRQTGHKLAARVKVALADFDADAGFLPNFVQTANDTQDYYDFDLVYLPFPSGVVVRGGLIELPDVPRFSLPAMRDFMVETPQELDVDVVVGLTRHLIANEKFSDLFTDSHVRNSKVRFVSTYGVRDYARQAGVSFAKATFSLCLTELLRQDERWALKEHEETVGCLLDFCDNRDDLVVSLKLMKFEHATCRTKVHDLGMLEAIDRLLDLELEEKLAAAEA